MWLNFLLEIAGKITGNFFLGIVYRRNKFCNKKNIFYFILFEKKNYKLIASNLINKHIVHRNPFTIILFFISIKIDEI